ncbi:MAG: anthranilate phosphoribosyltransferase [Candidatus Thorarchaeota archaeon]|nr:anthranilate phosphoribosyltransferase [Candidatus Thorarchaeota archaeon]
MIQPILAKLVERVDLTEQEASDTMAAIMQGVVSPAQVAGFLTALRMKGETAEELCAFAKIMRQTSIHINVPENALDTCGTGGDGTSSFNISTAAAFVIAGAGVPVAKHGNRGVSSKCGSADLLEATGIDISLTPLQVEQCISELGIGFLFAPTFHKAMKFVSGPRRELGLRTVFNLLGPLSNPAAVNYQLVGLFTPELTEKVAEVLCRFRLRRALVVHGSGLDELTTTGTTKVTEISGAHIDTYYVEPEEFGLRRVRPEDIRGGQPDHNRQILLDVLNGNASPYLDIVILNAGAGLYAADAVTSIRDGVELARDVIAEGSALGKLESLRLKSVELRGGRTQ